MVFQLNSQSCFNLSRGRDFELLWCSWLLGDDPNPALRASVNLQNLYGVGEAQADHEAAGLNDA